MKKVLLLATASLFLAGCGPQKTVNKPENAPAAQAGQQAAGEFGEIAAAIKAGKSARCEMKKTDNSIVMDYMIKGKKMKMVTLSATDAKKAGNMISDGEFMYTWSQNDTKGIKMKVPTPEELEEMKNGVQNSPQIPDLSSENEKQKLENLGYTVDCKVTDVADSEFIPPTTITFTDISVSMDKLKNITKADSQQLSKEEQDAMNAQIEEAMKQMKQ